ncbi:MAG: threonine/serine exporter family protein, partial [Muribaculaceae bacterium]|nr:threonine/serine exporter family protein [Muribaculaceae bacterium]
MWIQFFQDAFFAAIAAIGFAAISRPPRRAYLWCAIIAAIGHSSRFLLMNMPDPVHIIPATLVSSFLIGILAVFISP